ncbi:alpha/beta hydrolase [Angustibacter luteus]
MPDALSTYYDQKLSWTDCGDGYQCSKLTVPVDYADPSGATIPLSVIKLPAGKPKQRLGSLVVNPGGPGASGVDYARRASTSISAATRRAYDVVGFDPRGVATSDPLECLTDAQTDTFIGQDPTPDTPAEVSRMTAIGKGMGLGCQRADPALVGHVDTVSAARDMDVLRAALGDKRLFYLGKSYGTYLGATYADLFPTNIGRMVLDGAIDPRLSAREIDLGQAKGFEQATRAFVADCVDRSGCPLGSDVGRGMQRIQGLLASLDAKPLPSGDPSRPLTEGWGSYGIALGMYDKGFWPSLREALDQAFSRDGRGLMQLADMYADRQPDGTYAGNGTPALYAVNCLDRPVGDGAADVKAELPTFQRAAPTWGGLLAWGELPCTSWPLPATGKPHAVTAPGSPPIVVVGTTRDPATPYPWAQGLAEQLSDGHLITYRGDGHTAYMRGSRCVDKAVDAYLLRGTKPKDGLTC